MDYNYTITLADGQQLTGLGKNGDNFVSILKVDEGIFDNNLSTMTVSDGTETIKYNNMEFIQQMKWMDGTYYLAFRELSPQEIAMKKIQKSISDGEANMTDMQLALTQIYEMILGGM